VVTLRPSRRADLAFITGLERHPDNRELIGQWSDAEHVAAIAGEGGREHWVIERRERPAGYLIAFAGGEHYPGVYVKRILVGEKERGTGSAALAQFLDLVFARGGVDFAWLLVRAGNARAQAVYSKLGFRRFEPAGELAERLGRSGDSPFGDAIPMRVEASGWRSRAR
jgi:RimJ/RimL family protein N-acetyltransferase